MTNEHSLLPADGPRQAEDRSTDHARPTSPRQLLLLGLAAVAVISLFVLAFAGSATQVAARDLPIAVTGGDRAAAAVGRQLDQQLPDAVEPIATTDRAAAEALIQDREVYAAFVTAPTGGVDTVLVASAASPAVSQLVAELAPVLNAGDVVDVAPAPEDDPRGTGLAAGGLPLTIGGVIIGSLMALLVRGRGRRLIGIAGTSTVAGAVVVAMLHGWLGSLDGNVLAEIGVVALCIAAIALMLSGLYAAVGRGGLIVADVALILVGNPFSGATSAPELLPSGWSWVGHWMPLGSAIDALRGISGFGGAATTLPVLVLAGWALLGVVLLLLPGRHRTAESSSSSEAPGSSESSGSSESPEVVGAVT